MSKEYTNTKFPLDPVYEPKFVRDGWSGRLTTVTTAKEETQKAEEKKAHDANSSADFCGH